jgi:Dictyostelium (slime mold) repeat
MTSGYRSICLSLLAGVVWVASSDVARADKKVTVCHRPPGNAGSPQTISVGESATEAHLGHGDQMGACATGCQGNASLCDDGDACTSDTCLQNGQCGHAPVNCNDGNTCTTDLCQQATGCLNVPAEGPCPTFCDDGNACTSTDTCTDGQCRGTPVAGCCAADVNCDDGNSCTVDTCAGGACLNEPRNCSVADKCVAGFCDPASGACSTAPVSCDDNNVCTDDLCDSATGCFSMPTTNPPEPQETTCSDGADNDCDGAIDSADTDCDSCDNPGATVCTAGDAANFTTGLQSAVAAGLPDTLCLGRREQAFNGGIVESCFSSSGAGCSPGCLVHISYDHVVVGPASPGDVPFDFTLRTQFDVSFTMPVRFEILGIPMGSCTVAVQVSNLATESTGQGELVNGACTLRGRLLATTAFPSAGVSVSGCGVVDASEVVVSRLAELLGTFQINALFPVVSSYTPQCPVQP